jgi:diguanylate cyclase (GGDEF)-like protein
MIRKALLGALVVATLPLVTLSPASSYLVRSLTAIAAAVVLMRIGKMPGRLSRTLLGATLLTGILSGLVATAHLLMTGHNAPLGGAADWTYLAYAPLCAAGLLTLPRHPTEAGWRLMALADALIAVAGIGFLLAPVLVQTADDRGSSLGVRVVALAYPLCGMFVLAVLLAVMARAQEDLRPFLRTFGVGLVLLAVGDSGYSIASLHGWYTPTTWPAVLSQAGLVAFALAPFRGRRPLRLIETEPSAPRLAEVAAPCLTLVPAAALTLIMLVRHEPLSRTQMSLIVLAAGAMVVRALLTGVEQQRTVLRLQVRELEAVAVGRRDPLTGLINRTAMIEQLTHLLALPGRPGIALALLDLDDFKDINDTHGHETGDAVLLEVARRLRMAAPSGATVTRLGGDEFAVCVVTGDGPQPLGDALLAAFCAPVVVGTRRFPVSASIGVVMADAGGVSAAVALSHVDVAMYEAKAVKEPQRSSVVVLSGLAREQAAARVQMRDEVSRPDLTQFSIVYEPMVDLSDGSVVGAEALLRWNHPVLGNVPPSAFIPLAEQVGAIAELGEFALRTALGDLAGWMSTATSQGAPLGIASVGVNLSPRQLGVTGLCDLVRSLLAEHGLEPYRLVLEITEQALMDDWATAVEVVGELRSLGVGVAVDDFGTGYSSLRYLRRFDTSTVKIDQEFVQAMPDEPRTRALVASVLEMARSLDLYTVAEGIETLDQLQVVRGLGCRFAQGFLFDRPMRAEAFGALLLGRHRYPMGAHPQSALRTMPLPREEPAARQVVPTSLPVIPRRLG